MISGSGADDNAQPTPISVRLHTETSRFESASGPGQFPAHLETIRLKHVVTKDRAGNRRKDFRKKCNLEKAAEFSRSSCVCMSLYSSGAGMSRRANCDCATWYTDIGQYGKHGAGKWLKRSWSENKCVKFFHTPKYIWKGKGQKRGELLTSPNPLFSKRKS